MIPRFLRTYSTNRWQDKNFHMRAQSAPYGAIFPKTVAYAKYDRASSNLSFTPRNFCSNCVELVSFRDGFPKTRRERPIFDPPILGHIHGLSFLWGAAIWGMCFATGYITWLHAVGSYLVARFRRYLTTRRLFHDLSESTYAFMWVCCADEGVFVA